MIDPSTGLPLRSTIFVDAGYDRTPDYTVGLTNTFKYKKLSLNEAALTTKVEAAVTDLARRVDRIGIVAWSFGVWYAWKMGIAHADRVRALALFYGIGPNEPKAPTTPVLAHYAEHDEFEDIGFARQVEREMKAAGHDITVELYPGTKHWFDEPSRPEYDKAASTLAWDRTRALFEKHLGK